MNERHPVDVNRVDVEVDVGSNKVKGVVLLRAFGIVLEMESDVAERMAAALLQQHAAGVRAAQAPGSGN